MWQNNKNPEVTGKRPKLCISLSDDLGRTRDLQII